MSANLTLVRAEPFGLMLRIEDGNEVSYLNPMTINAVATFGDSLRLILENGSFLVVKKWTADQFVAWLGENWDPDQIDPESDYGLMT